MSHDTSVPLPTIARQKPGGHGGGGRRPKGDEDQGNGRNVPHAPRVCDECKRRKRRCDYFNTKPLPCEYCKLNGLEAQCRISTLDGRATRFSKQAATTAAPTSSVGMNTGAPAYAANPYAAGSYPPGTQIFSSQAAHPGHAAHPQPLSYHESHHPGPQYNASPSQALYPPVSHQQADHTYAPIPGGSSFYAPAQHRTQPGNQGQLTLVGSFQQLTLDGYARSAEPGGQSQANPAPIPPASIHVSADEGHWQAENDYGEGEDEDEDSASTPSSNNGLSRSAPTNNSIRPPQPGAGLTRNASAPAVVMTSSPPESYAQPSAGSSNGFPYGPNRSTNQAPYGDLGYGTILNGYPSNGFAHGYQESNERSTANRTGAYSNRTGNPNGPAAHRYTNGASSSSSYYAAPPYEDNQYSEEENYRR